MKSRKLENIVPAARIAVALLAIVAVLGCRKEAPDDKTPEPGAGGTAAPQTEADRTTPLAVVDDVTITVGDLQDQINNQSPYLRPRYKSVAKQKEFLQTMIRFEILAQEAKARGFDKHPDVIRAAKQIMITKLMEDEFEKKLSPESIPEADMRAHFEQNKAEYQRAEQVRVSAIIVKDAQAAKRIADEAKGEAGSTTKKFRGLVKKYSADEATKKRGGDLEYFGRDDNKIPAAVIEAAFGMKRTGEVVGPIAGGKTFYIIKQTGKKKAVSKNFESVKRSIQNRLYREKRAQAQRGFITKLRGAAKIEIDEESFEKVTIDTSKPSKSFEQDGHQH